MLLVLLIPLMIGAMILLIVRAQNTWNQVWSVYLLVLFLLWLGTLWFSPYSGGMLWGAILPPLLIVPIFYAWYARARHEEKRHGPNFPESAAEPLMSYEESRGPAGTKEVFRLYILITVLALLIFGVVTYLYSFVPR